MAKEKQFSKKKRNLKFKMEKEMQIEGKTYVNLKFNTKKVWVGGK